MSNIRLFPAISQYGPVFLTIAAYTISTQIHKKTKLAIFSPILVSAAIVITVLFFTGTSNESYQTGVRFLSFLLTPATICLGLSLYEQIQILKNNLPAILMGVIVGTIISLSSVMLISFIFHLDRVMLVSFLPKSVTSAIGFALSEEAGGIGAITTAAIIITGNLGVLLGPGLCKIFHLTHPIARGVAYGTSSHVIGTTKASEESELTGAVSSLSLSIAGLVTAVFYPVCLTLTDLVH